MEKNDPQKMGNFAKSHGVNRIVSNLEWSEKLRHTLIFRTRIFSGSIAVPLLLGCEPSLILAKETWKPKKNGKPMSHQAIGKPEKAPDP